MEPQASESKIVLVTGANRGLDAHALDLLRSANKCFNPVASNDRWGGIHPARGLSPALPVLLAVAAGLKSRPARDKSRPTDLPAACDAIHYDDGQRVTAVDWDIVTEAFEVNTLGPWRTALTFLPLLKRSAHPRIVNVSSESGSLASMSGGTPAYSLSKAGLSAVTRMLASELMRDGFRVNAVCPGWTATDMGGGGGRPVEEGAKGIVWAALLPDHGPTGGFFRDGVALPW